MSDTGKIKFEDEVTALTRVIGDMFEKKATLIIALGSAGYDKAKAILDEMSSIDLMISGGGKSVYQGNGKQVRSFMAIDILIIKCLTKNNSSRAFGRDSSRPISAKENF